MRNEFIIVWFLLGLGNFLQVVASLSMTEIAILSWAPFLVVTEYSRMKRTGAAMYFWMTILVLLGGLVAIFVYSPPSYFIIRKLATIVLLGASAVVMHYLLRKCPTGFKWFFLASAISLVLSTFIFQQSVEQNMYGADANAIMGGTIYWIRRVGAFMQLPYKGWYLSSPTWLNVASASFMAVFSMVTSASGRSAALGAIGAVVLMFVAGKTSTGMKRVGRYFILFVVAALVGVSLLNIIYGKLAESGSLGEDSRAKYVRQTQGGKGIASLLIGGRSDSIAPIIITAENHPIVGFGLMPLDDQGYYEDFLRRFGATEDYEEYVKWYWHDEAHGKIHFLPGHSCIGGFWLQYGIAGLVFWLYIVFILVRYIKADAHAMPMWYGWLGCGLPSTLWMIFFSPFAYRIDLSLMVMAVLLTRAVRKGVPVFQLR